LPLKIFDTPMGPSIFNMGHKVGSRTARLTKAFEKERWTPQNIKRPDSGLNDMVTQRVAYQVSDVVQLQLAHHIGAVCVDGLKAETQGGSDFSAPVALCEELNDFPFSRGHPIAQPFEDLRKRLICVELTFDHRRGFRSKERFVPGEGFHSNQEIMVRV
jgi:hypothetical protein